MYRAAQARETVRLLAENRIVMSQEDLEVVDLPQLPAIQQKMLDGSMTRPKGVALVQADEAGRKIAEYEAEFLGRTLLEADPENNLFITLTLIDQVGILTLTRPDALKRPERGITRATLRPGRGGRHPWDSSRGKG